MKWLLISTLICVIMLIAFALTEQYKDKFDFYNNLKIFLNQFKINLSFKQEKVNEFLSKTECKKQFKIFIDEYKNYLKTDNLSFEKIKILEQNERLQLENIVKCIGKYNAQSEIEQLDSFILDIDEKLKKANEDKTKLCPLIIKLSLLFAIGLAILLI